MLELIGRFHPVLVHLPIGILLIASLFYFLSAKEKYASLRSAVNISLFWGMLSAIASGISGFLLSRSDDYDASLISKHQWLGIATALVSMVAYYLAKKNNKQLKWIILLMVLLIIITGHLGGSITHGSDYLTGPLTNSNSQTDYRKPIPDVQNAVVYTDVIQPMLQSKCYGCHGPNKQKGKLRLDAEDFILKGGEDGKVIIPGRADESDLIERILLPKDDDDHMPPKEKPQLTKQDMDLLHWWVGNGADFTKKVNELPQTDKIKPALAALQSGEMKEDAIASDLPDMPVEKADDKIIQQLKERGVAVSTISAGSNYLAVNFIAIDTVRQSDLKLLQSIKKQLLWLKLGNKKLSSALISELAGLNTLTKIYLDRTALTDEGLKTISSLSKLQYINIIGNPVTAKGIEQLKELKELKHLYIYQTAVNAAGFEALRKTFPKTIIDTGGYKVPTLASDTTELKEAIKRNQ